MAGKWLTYCVWNKIKRIDLCNKYIMKLITGFHCFR
jgi:hypothetical protein